MADNDLRNRIARAAFKAGAENAALVYGLDVPVRWEDMREEDLEQERARADGVLAVLPAPTVAPDDLWDAIHAEVVEAFEDEQGEKDEMPTRAEMAVVVTNAADRAVAAADPRRTEAEVRADERERIISDLRNEANRARRAYRSTPTDHFAHDYCRWVGHAEALTAAAGRAARLREEVR